MRVSTTPEICILGLQQQAIGLSQVCATLGHGLHMPDSTRPKRPPAYAKLPSIQLTPVSDPALVYMPLVSIIGKTCA